MVSIAFDIDHLAASLSYLLASTAHGPRRVRFFSGNPKHDLFAKLTAYVESGAIRPVVDTVHPLSDIMRRAPGTGGGGRAGKACGAGGVTPSAGQGPGCPVPPGRRPTGA